MKKLLYLFVISAVLLSCNDQSGTNTDLDAEEIQFTKEGELKIHKQDSSVVDLEIELAETEYETSTGLMYRKDMQQDRGMLFLFENEQIHSFYMKNTEFSLDIIYINKDWKIASIAKEAQPFNEESLPSQVPVQYVLEVNGGMSEKWNVREGDSISWKKTGS